MEDKQKLAEYYKNNPDAIVGLLEGIDIAANQSNERHAAELAALRAVSASNDMRADMYERERDEARAELANKEREMREYMRSVRESDTLLRAELAQLRAERNEALDALWCIKEQIIMPDGKSLRGAVAEVMRERDAARAEAQQLREALDAAIVVRDDDVYYRTAHDISMDIPERIAKKIRAALDATKGANHAD